jgi:hypothetical protein
LKQFPSIARVAGKNCGAHSSFNGAVFTELVPLVIVIGPGLASGGIYATKLCPSFQYPVGDPPSLMEICRPPIMAFVISVNIPAPVIRTLLFMLFCLRIRKSTLRNFPIYQYGAGFIPVTDNGGNGSHVTTSGLATVYWS